LGRWNRKLAPDSDLSLQVYFDRYNRVESAAAEKLNTIDFDLQHRIKIGSRNDFISGIGYRAMSDEFAPGFATTLTPAHRQTNLFSAFVQDELQVLPTVSLTVGSKFEHNSYTGFEFEPSVRLVWTPVSHQTVWTSASRAIRQPSRADANLQLDFATFPAGGGLLGVQRVVGNPNRNAEQLRDFEVGYRAQLNKQLSIDIATYLGFYKRLVTYEVATPFLELSPAPPHLVVPLLFDEKASATNYGVEFFLNWNVNSKLRISPGYSANRSKVRLDPSSTDVVVEATPGLSPAHKFQVRSLVNLSQTWNWDSSIAYTGRLSNGNIPSYVRLDSRLGWHIGESMEFSIVGQNLLSPRHFEFPGNSDFTLPTEVQRSVFGKITWRF